MKHRIISLAAVLVIGITCYAQSSMTDDQVIEFVKSESEKGTSQQGIVTALLKKGVSSAQLQRVRRKADEGVGRDIDRRSKEHTGQQD